MKNKKNIALIIPDISYTFISEIVLTISFFYFLRLLGEAANLNSIGEYTLLRRELAVLIPIAFFGIPDAISNIINSSKDTNVIKNKIIECGLIILFLIILIISSFMLDLFKIKYMFFGDEFTLFEKETLYIFYVGLCFHGYCFFILRSLRKIKYASLINICNIGILPILIWELEFDINNTIKFLGIIYIISSLIILILLIGRIRVDINISSGIKIIKLGMTKVGASIGMPIFLAITPMIASKFISIKITAYTSLSITLIIGIVGLTYPIGTVLLPHFSYLRNSGDFSLVTRSLHILVSGLSQVIIFVVGQLLIFNEYLLVFWMGDKFKPAIVILSIMIPSIVGLSYFSILKNIIDSVSVRGENSYNIFVAIVLLALLSTLSLIALPNEAIAHGLAVSFLTSSSLLGILSYKTLNKLIKYRDVVDLNEIKKGIISYAPILILTIIITNLIDINIYSFILVNMILCIFYIYILKYNKSHFARSIFKVIKWKN